MQTQIFDAMIVTDVPGDDDRRRRDERHRLAHDRAARHSQRVRILKFGLPVAVALMVAGFGARAWLSGLGVDGAAIDAVGISDGLLTMRNPSLEGRTADDRPFRVTAETATRATLDSPAIAMKGIEASLPLGDGRSGRLVADDGNFDNDARKLDLAGDIVFTTPDGMTARLRTARIDVDAGTMSTGEAVDIRSDGSQITADSMQVLDNGKTMVFERKVRVVIAPTRLQTYGLGAGANQAGE